LVNGKPVAATENGLCPISRTKPSTSSCADFLPSRVLDEIFEFLT
jgi:hypothetical protein